MATVHFGRLRGAADFARIVAVKRLHPQFANEPEFVAMFLDEARLAARIQHPNVVAPLDLGEVDGELFVVFEYIHGESLSKLLASSKQAPPPLPVVSAIVAGLCRGLHAAHEATGPAGEPLGIVHRDVSPQNVLVGADGVPRLIDFGVAKARARLATTREGEIKGKLAYMAPEQLRGRAVTPASDVYAAGVVLWEALAGRRLFVADSEGALIERVLIGLVAPPSTFRPEVSQAFDALVLRALDGDPAARFASAREMAEALEALAPPASISEVAAWVRVTASEALARRAARIAQIERAAAETAVGRTSPSTPSAARAPRRRVGVLAIGAVGISALAAATLALRSGASTASTGVIAPELPVTAAPARDGVSSAAVPSPSVLPEAAPSPNAVGTPSEAASAPVAPRTTSAAIPPSPPRASAARPSPRPADRRPNCKIPFTLDAQGRKTYKQECL
jgi:serine/threonine-protein kinase